MKQLRYTLRFTTPAFMGNAEQNAQWRTPPIKALLRQWWRVAYAADKNFDVHLDEMRKEEGLLFGVASDGDLGGSRKSLVRIRLDRWDVGKMKKSDWPELGMVHHPEVAKPIASDLYLGFGPVINSKNSPKPTTIKANAAIQAGESAQLSIAVPESDAALVEQALSLMHLYGTAGGRSRNGWGSFELEGESLDKGAPPLRPWQDCLDRDWPHAVGKDEKGALIWQTAPHDDWKALMKTLAVLKIGLRTQKPHLEFKLDTSAGDEKIKHAIKHGRPQGRHWLSYPVTNHPVKQWGNNARLPNSLRFKVRQTAEGKLVGIIFHVPHLPPPAFHPRLTEIVRVWKLVHQFLDAKLVRIGK